MGHLDTLFREFLNTGIGPQLSEPSLLLIADRDAGVPLNQELVQDDSGAHLGQMGHHLVLGTLDIHLDHNIVLRQEVSEQPGGKVHTCQARRF